MQDMMTTASKIGASLERFPMHYSPFHQASKQKISGDPDYVEQFSEAYLRRCNLILRLEDEPLAALVRAGEVIQANDDLLEWAGFYHYLLYDTHILKQNPGSLSFPLPSREIMGEHRELFLLLAQLSGLWRSVHRYRQIGVSDEIIRATYHDVSIWMHWYRQHYQRWGFTNSSWLTYHAHTQIFRLGRLAFIAGKFKGDIEVLRPKHAPESEEEASFRESSNHLVLAQDRTIFTEDGMRLSAQEESRLHEKLRTTSLFSRDQVLPKGTWMVNHDRENIWLRPGESNWYTIIREDGLAERKQLTVHWDDYERVLYEGVPVMNVHIPPGDDLQIEEVHASLEHALRFFARENHPTEFMAFVCTAWVLDPQFDIIIRRPSNILDFQDIFHLYPVTREEQRGLRHIFGPHITRDLPQDWPQETSLQRSLLQFRNQGYRHTEGGGYILRDELIQQYIAEERLDAAAIPKQTKTIQPTENDHTKPALKQELSG